MCEIEVEAAAINGTASSSLVSRHLKSKNIYGLRVKVDIMKHLVTKKSFGRKGAIGQQHFGLSNSNCTPALGSKQFLTTFLLYYSA